LSHEDEAIRAELDNIEKITDIDIISKYAMCQGNHFSVCRDTEGEIWRARSCSGYSYNSCTLSPRRTKSASSATPPGSPRRAPPVKSATPPGSPWREPPSSKAADCTIRQLPLKESAKSSVLIQQATNEEKGATVKTEQPDQLQAIETNIDPARQLQDMKEGEKEQPGIGNSFPPSTNSPRLRTVEEPDAEPVDETPVQTLALENSSKKEDVSGSSDAALTAAQPSEDTTVLGNGSPSCESQNGGELEVKSGDVVMLSDRVPQEYRTCPAIVTSVAEKHCTVAVLDEARQVGIGECWPGFHDISLVSSMLRLGTQVVISGMGGARTKHLNGLTGTICEHPREGHPSFVRKPSSPDKPQLTVCISFNDPSASSGRAALVEPRFLISFEDATLRATESLEEAASSLPVQVNQDCA